MRVVEIMDSGRPSRISCDALVGALRMRSLETTRSERVQTERSETGSTAEIPCTVSGQIRTRVVREGGVWKTPWGVAVHDAMTVEAISGAQDDHQSHSQETSRP
jgi:hypothetical protein